MRFSTLFVFSFCLVGAFAQKEVLNPVLTNPELNVHYSAKPLAKTPNTFDSTFFYTTDTVTLPFFDDFSSNRFQKYNAQAGDPNVTSELYHRMLDPGNGTPFPDNSKFSTVQTYLRRIDVTNGTQVDSLFDPISIDYNSLANYPVNYDNGNYYPHFILIDTINHPNEVTDNIDTLFPQENIVEQASAVKFVVEINDPSALWLDSRAYHNYRFARDPWTLGVATFDGLDESGYPYSIGSNGSDFADALTSKPINLSGFNPSDSLYLTFLYQAEGFGDKPEEGVDSLRLEFMNPATNNWEYVWSATGGVATDFNLVHIPIKTPAYFQNGFQMRFRNYGSLAGSLDHFHLDYVDLNQNRTFADTLLKDFAIVYPVTSLLKDYQSVPWDHYKNNPNDKMSSNVEVVVRNGNDQASNNQNGTIEIDYNSVTEAQFTLLAQQLSGGAINYAPRTTYYSYHDLSGGYYFDETKTGTKQIFEINASISAQFSDQHPENEQSTYEQFFSNYYAYDDGTAEKAFGITGDQARLAIRFTPYEADSVIGAEIHFVPSVRDASLDLFVLSVWADNNGVPGELLYQDNLLFPKSPIYETSNNKFWRYYFVDQTKVPVNGTFHIGWRQFDGESMNVGFDMNNDNSDKNHFSIDGVATWINSDFEGSIMIRPIFSTELDAELGIETVAPVETNFELFPNPSSNTVTLRFNQEIEQPLVSIYALDGKLMKRVQTNSFDITDLQNGMYLVQVEGIAKTQRLIKN